MNKWVVFKKADRVEVTSYFYFNRCLVSNKTIESIQMLLFFQITVDIGRPSEDFAPFLFVSRIALRTTLGKWYRPYGFTTSNFKTEQVDVSGKVLRYIEGSSSDVLNSLTFYFA